MTDEQLLAARAAFVKKIKKDEEFSEAWSRTSLKQHWSGALRGFADERLQRRWEDYLAGWKAAKSGG